MSTQRRFLILDYKIEREEHSPYVAEELQSFTSVKILYKLQKEWGSNQDAQWLVEEIMDMNGEIIPKEGIIRDINGTLFYLWE